MSTGIPVSSIINVQVNLAPIAAPYANFNSLLIVGDSNVIDVGQRIRSYGTLSAVAADFGTAAQEYLAAQLFFSQQPQPNQLYIGRWANAATAGLLHGSTLVGAQQLLANFASITNGGLNIAINGAAANVTGLNFASATNLNGVASTLQTALAALSAGTTVTWNGQYFTITSGTTGAGAAASLTATFSANPAANDTITINGVTITFVSALTTGNQVLIGANAAATIQNLLTFVKASALTGLTALNYGATTGTFVVTFPTTGIAGNSIAVTKSSTAITLSGATLTGGIVPSTVSYGTTGAGQDISALFGLTSTTASPPVAGANAETLVAAIQALDSLSTNWYGVMTACNSGDIADSDRLAVAAYIQATQHIYGVSTSNTNVLSSTVTSDIASLLSSGLYTRTIVQYSQIPHVIASLFGRAFTVDFTASNSVITLAYKQEPGVNPESLTSSQVAALIAKRCNYFASYSNGTAILMNAVMSGPAYFDEIQGTDALANAVQTNVFNLLYTTGTKVPQTDEGTGQIVNVIEATLAAYVNNGLLAPGTWQTTGFGTLQLNDFLPKGYYVYAPAIATQAPATRATRVSVTIQIAAKLAGAIQSANIIINVNR